MRNKAAKIMITLGIVCVIASLSLFIYNQIVSSNAAQFAEKTVKYLQEDTHNVPKIKGNVRYKRLDGNDFIGYISIPSLRLNLPVMKDWSYEKLNVSPCRYSGLPETDDFVIAAHNYSSHFGFISSLKKGDAVCFTDVNGVQSNYQVELIDTLSPTSVKDMTAGEYDLTLFTCTYSGEARVTVRLKRF